MDFSSSSTLCGAVLDYQACARAHPFAHFCFLPLWLKSVVPNGSPWKTSCPFNFISQPVCWRTLPGAQSFGWIVQYTHTHTHTHTHTFFNQSNFLREIYFSFLPRINHKRMPPFLPLSSPKHPLNSIASLESSLHFLIHTLLMVLTLKLGWATPPLIYLANSSSIIMFTKD